MCVSGLAAFKVGGLIGSPPLEVLLIKPCARRFAAAPGTLPCARPAPGHSLARSPGETWPMRCPVGFVVPCNRMPGTMARPLHLSAGCPKLSILGTAMSCSWAWIQLPAMERARRQGDALPDGPRRRRRRRGKRKRTKCRPRCGLMVQRTSLNNRG